MVSAVLCTWWVTLTGKADDTILVSGDGPVLFQVVSEAKVLSCVGKFANTAGNFDGPFSSSVRVKFGAAAEGRSNPCTVTVTTIGPAGQSPVTETEVIHVVVPKMQSRTLAHVPDSSDERTTLGVGEEVMFTMQPRELLLDSDVVWNVSYPWNRTSPRRGLGTVYQALPPNAKECKRYRITTDGEFPGGMSPRLPDGTDGVTLFFGGARGSAQAWFRTFQRRHTPDALAAAYRAQLDRTEAQLDAGRWLFEPIPIVEHDVRAQNYGSSQGFYSALLAVSTMMTHAPGAPSAEQSPELKNREVRLVARMVAACYQAVDPAVDLYNGPRDTDITPPAGYRMRKGKEGIYSGPIPPENIEPADLRRQYGKALAAQYVKIAYFNKQMRADWDSEKMQRFAYHYLQELCGRSDPHLEQFRHELIALGIDEPAAQKLSEKPED